MTYWMWLAALSGVFLLLERIVPRAREQRLLRPGIATDHAQRVESFPSDPIRQALSPIRGRSR